MSLRFDLKSYEKAKTCDFFNRRDVELNSFSYENVQLQET